MALQRVSLRLDEEIVNYIKSETKRRKISTEMDMWRLVIERGMAQLDTPIERIDSIFRLSIQNLCVANRVLITLGEENGLSEKLIGQAYDEADKQMKKVGLI